MGGGVGKFQGLSYLHPLSTPFQGDYLLKINTMERRRGSASLITHQAS
jgi:hypothetical protein